jgi:hypothetical protein
VILSSVRAGRQGMASVVDDPAIDAQPPVVPALEPSDGSSSFVLVLSEAAAL